MRKVVSSLLLCSFISVSFCLPFKSLLQLDPFRGDLLSLWSIGVDLNPTCENTTCLATHECPLFDYHDYATCVNQTCQWTPNYITNVCTSLDQCRNNASCVCHSGLSTGCKCSSSDDCEFDYCNNGFCQLYPFIGQVCRDGDCNFGTCNEDGICEFIDDGERCSSNDCQISSECINSICTPMPVCNSTYPDGYCNEGGFCVNGTCHPQFTYTAGMPCHVRGSLLGMCEVGLACLNTSGEWLCEEVPFGSPCSSTLECAFATEYCFCNQANDSMECGDIGLHSCRRQVQNYFQCTSINNCYIYDIYNTSNPCGKNCLALKMELSCCALCDYREYRNNAWPNVSGKCADHTVEFVDCCDPTAPCTIATTADICEGYVNKYSQDF